jgi:putative transcriptional regulator
MQLVNLCFKLLVSNNRNSLINPPIVLILSQKHDDVLGLVLNQPIGRRRFSEVFDLIKDVSPGLMQYNGSVELLSGGAWNKGKVFILHSNDYDKDILLKVTDDVFLSCNEEILKEIARGKGPKQRLIIVGISRWSPEEFEKDLWDNNWVICNPDPDVIFSEDTGSKWVKALAANGMNAASYMQQAGHC